MLPPVSNRRVVDFGAGVGRKSVYLYNLPEVSSGHQVGWQLFLARRLLTGVQRPVLSSLPVQLARGALRPPGVLLGCGCCTNVCHSSGWPQV